MFRTRIPGALAAITLAAALAACSSGSSSSGGSGGGGSTVTTVQLQAYSGTPRAWDGTWTTCFSNNTHGVDERDTWVMSGAAFTVTFDEYPASSGCTGALTHIVTVSGTASVTGTKSGVTWTDGNTIIGQAPAKAAGGGTLPDPVTVSLVALTVTASDNPAQPLGTEPKMLYVDDSAAVWQLYAEKKGLPDCDDTSAVGKCLGTADDVSKQ